MPGKLTSLTPQARTVELRDLRLVPVELFTGAGRNGVRSFRLTDGVLPVDLTPVTSLKVVVKTSELAAEDELDASMPLTATITSAGGGEFSVDFSAVDFQSPQSRVLLAVYDDSGANPVILSQAYTVIRRAAV